ncbi:MAG TPA: NAD(P)H-binding protein, partial [Solirubrobacterales bacterium]|nr:NAD(P)H-binding protein [Solirubrobacterales bacterium]
RPGPLTDDPPRGLVKVGQDLERVEISRADVAAVLAACLELRHTIDRSFEVVGGEIAIDAALASI